MLSSKDRYSTQASNILLKAMSIIEVTFHLPWLGNHAVNTCSISGNSTAAYVMYRPICWAQVGERVPTVLTWDIGLSGVSVIRKNRFNA